MKFNRYAILALAGLLNLGLTAGDLTATLKGGVGVSRKDGVKDHLAFGFAYGFDLSKDSQIVTELGYFYQPGRGANVAIPANSLGSVMNPDGGPGASTNFQKSSTQGITLRGLYRSTFSGPWSWQAGLMVGNLKSRMDATGDIRDTTNAQAGGWAINPEKTNFSASPVLGLTYTFTELGYFEMNIVSVNYKQVTLTPTFVSGGTGTNRAVPTIGDKTVNHLDLEFGFAFRF